MAVHSVLVLLRRGLWVWVAVLCCGGCKFRVMKRILFVGSGEGGGVNVKQSTHKTAVCTL